VASVVFQQRIYAHCLIAGQVAVDHRIRQRNQQPVIAVAALDTWFLTNTGSPLVGAGRRVA
jgi:hypothetical protein